MNEPLQRRELNEDEVRSLDRGACPDCGAQDMLAGPSAGLSQDVACRECG